MLLDLFKSRKCFKLICGAGNEDVVEVEKLVALYSKAGCNFFDICAKPQIVDAAKKGLARAGITKDRYICCSVGAQNDPHISKAHINQDLCTQCGKCSAICPESAINVNNGICSINKIKCIGCGKCQKECPKECITITSEPQDLGKILPPLTEKGIDCIEFHASGENEQELDEKWEKINTLFDGTLSICMDRSHLGNEKSLQCIRNMLKSRKPYTTIIQTDGIPMSGGKDDYKTTLQTIAAAEIIQNENLPVYIMLSGGTNSKTTKLATMCGIHFDGIAIGSFARKIVREYTNRNDFFENETIFNKALEIAKDLVDTSLNNMNDITVQAATEYSYKNHQL